MEYKIFLLVAFFSLDSAAVRRSGNTANPRSENLTPSNEQSVEPVAYTFAR